MACMTPGYSCSNRIALTKAVIGILDSNDGFRITGNTAGTVFFDSSVVRQYTLLGCTNLVEADWQPVAAPRLGLGGSDSMASTNAPPQEFYKLQVELP